MVATTTSVSSISNAQGGSCNHGIQGSCTLCSSSTSYPFPSYTSCVHGTFYGGQCGLCNNTGPISVGYCTCNTWSNTPCPLHGYVPLAAPSFTTWPPTPVIPVVDLCKDGHTVTHEMITDEKGLKIVFTCTYCKEAIFKKYLVKIPRSIREEKCLNRVLNPK